VTYSWFLFFNNLIAFVSWFGSCVDDHWVETYSKCNKNINNNLTGQEE